MRRVVAHMDIDAFYASVELLRHPELRGKPVVVSGSGPRAVVTTASYEARRFGIGSAMPTSRALRLCPEAILIPPDFQAYRSLSKQVWELVAAEVDVLEQAGLDEAYAELSSVRAPKALMRRLVEEVRAATGLGMSVGIGPNKLIAKVASDCEKPAGLVALSREMACERFAFSPPKLLPGVGPKTADRLEALGVRTLEELRRAPEDLLRESVGDRLGQWLRRRAEFVDDTPVAPRGAAVSRSNETTFPTDVSDRAELERALTGLAHRLCETLAASGTRGRNVAIKVRLDDWTTVTRARMLPKATNAREEVAGAACDLLRIYDPPRPVRLIGVRVSAFEGGADRQLSLPGLIGAV